MIVKRLAMCFLFLFCTSIRSYSSTDDIESRLIYSDYSKKISMDFRDVSLTDVLKAFSKQSGMNFIASSDVSAIKITLFLENVPIEDALGKILDANNLTYVLDESNNLFIVKAKDVTKTITKVYRLKNAAVSESKLNSDGTKKSGIKSALENIVSKEGKVQEDLRTNSILVTDVPEQFPMIDETIIKLDIPAVQILIQVEIIDASKADTEKLGIKYYNSKNNSLISVQGASRQNLYPWDLNSIQRKSINADGDGFSEITPYKFEQLTRTPGATDFSNIKLALDLLKSKGSTRVLARPRVMTLNNETAHIEVGGEQTVSVSSVTTTPTSGNSTTTDTPLTKQVGVILDVTPQADVNTGEIIMKIIPEVTDTVERTEFRVNNNPVFDVQKRKAISVMKAKNGQTIVLGGLLRTETSKSVDKVPFLGDLPLIGSPFRHKSETKNERELIIVITPYIVDENLKKKLDQEISTHLDREGTDPDKMGEVDQLLNSTENSMK